MMSTIETDITRLTPVQKQELLYALEEGVSKIVILDINHFVGVNVEGIKGLKIENRVGDWCNGTYEKN